MWDWLHALEEARARGTPVALVTVVTVAGSAPREVGAKMVVGQGDGEAKRLGGSIGGGHLEQLAVGDAAKALASGESKMIRYPLGATAGQCCGGVVEVFVDVLPRPPVLYLFGAGHVGLALCRVLEGTPFQVHAVDERPEWLEQLPAHVVRHDAPWDEVIGKMASDDSARTYVAIMTHRHDVDEAIVAWAARRPLKYVGLIGSQTKWNRFKGRLKERGLSDDDLGRVKCPIGLDLGGKAPPEVAVSIAAELLRVHHGR